jgi:hypothetical protein
MQAEGDGVFTERWTTERANATKLSAEEAKDVVRFFDRLEPLTIELA